MRLPKRESNKLIATTKPSSHLSKSSLSLQKNEVAQIFLVEAEDLDRELVASVLLGEGHGVIAASDGHIALSLLKSLELSPDKFPFSLIVLSWNLPKRDGAELCRWLRGEGNLVPILILNSKDNKADPLSFIEAGANDYLCKPFNVRELIARCQNLCQCNPLSYVPESRVLEFEELTVYLQEHRVIVRGKEVNLALKEFRLLELFISYPGRTWSRQELLKQIWKGKSVNTTKTLDVHIRWLRQKLEINPGEPKYITTVPRVGYRFG